MEMQIVWNQSQTIYGQFDHLSAGCKHMPLFIVYTFANAVFRIKLFLLHSIYNVYFGQLVSNITVPGEAISALPGPMPSVVFEDS